MRRGKWKDNYKGSHAIYGYLIYFRLGNAHNHEGVSGNRRAKFFIYFNSQEIRTKLAFWFRKCLNAVNFSRMRLKLYKLRQAFTREYQYPQKFSITCLERWASSNQTLPKISRSPNHDWFLGRNPPIYLSLPVVI